MSKISNVTFNKKWPVKAQVHRFGDCVAIYVGTGETVYLPLREAYDLQHAIEACCTDIEKHPRFVDSKFSTFNLQIDKPV